MKTRTLFPLIGLTVALPLMAQDWQVVDTFEGGEPQAEWTITSTPTIDTSQGYLSVGMAEGTNSTASLSVPLPTSFSSGQFTMAFDFYLPNVPEGFEHNVGFGVGNADQIGPGSWNASGLRNRFQMIGPAPQDLGNAGDWGVDPEDPAFGTAQPDALGDTEFGVWYNIWLVYTLDDEGKGITVYSKKAMAPMEDGLHSEFFAFDDSQGEDWSAIEYFALGQGLMTSPPEGAVPSDVAGALFDNLYVSAGENLTEKPTSVELPWVEVDTFDDEGPDSEWSVQEGIAVDFTESRLFVTGSAANVGLSVALPIVSDMRQSFTLAFDMMLPEGETGVTQMQFAVVGADQEAASGGEFFGGNDRFITFGLNAPQALANFGDWPPTLGPDLLGGSQLDTWYHVWLVYDGSAGTVDFYAVPISDPVDEVELPAEPAGSFNLEVDYTEFSHFVLGTGLVGNGEGIIIDNLYQALGSNITLSPTAGDFGSGGNEVVSLWVDVPAANAEGDKQAGIGWINDVAYPYVYHYSIGGMTVILDNFSSLEAMFIYDYKNNAWYWANDAWGGWHYKYSDPDYGLDGWADWTPNP